MARTERESDLWCNFTVLFDISLLTTEKRKHSNSTQHNHYDVTESCHRASLQKRINKAVRLDQGSPNFFFNGPDDNVDLWSRARFEGNIIERLCNFTDLNIERI